MSPSNKETADLIRRVAGITSSVIPPQAALPKGGKPVAPTNQPEQPRQSSVIPTDWDALDTQQKEAENLVGQIAQGGMNAVGYVFRVLTGLGRGYTNAYAHMLPAQNAIFDTLKDGVQMEDFPKLWDKYGELRREGTTGFLKGVAISGLPQSKEWFESGDGKKLYETGSDVFQSKDFANSMQRLRSKGISIGNLGTEKANQEVWSMDVPLIGKVALTENEAFGLGWDIVTDPASYATLGLAGAVKGATRGISTATAFAKAGKPANFASVAPKALPRPFYASPNISRTARKATKSTPLINPTYTIANTSTLTYIAKEMGRGFVEAHRSRLNRISARTSLMAASHAMQENFSEQMLKEGAELTDQYIEEVIGMSREQVLFKQREELAAQGIKDPNEIARIQAETAAALKTQSEELVKRADEWRGLFSGEDALATLARLAEANGITPIQEGAFQIADRTARGLRRTTLAVPKTKKERFNSETALSFSRGMNDAADPKSGSGEFGTLWDSLKSGDKATLKSVFDSLVKPIGYRERPAMEAKAAADAKATETQDIIEATSGTGLNVMGSKNRTPVQDVKAVDEAIPGTGKTRRVYKQKPSKELRQLMKAARLVKDTRQGAGSALTSPGKFKSFTQQDIMDAPEQFLTNLTKNYYEDVVMATAKSAKPWDKLTTSQKAKITEQILEDPSVITAEVFNKSMVLPTVMAARVAYLSEREIAQTTMEFTRISWFKDKKYNPLTATATHLKLRDFAFSKEDIKEGVISYAEATKLMLTLAGRIQDKDLNKVLRQLNVKLDSLYEGEDLMNLDRIAEILEQAHVAAVAKERDAFILKLKLQDTSEMGAENLVDPNLLDASTESLFGEYLAGLTAKGALATKEEIEGAVKALDQIHTAQKEASEKLTELGFDWMGIGKPGFLVLSRLESPKSIGRKASSTEAKALAEIRTVIKGPEVKPTTAVTQKEAFGEITAKLKEIEARPTTSQTTKDAINKIRLIMIESPDGKKLTSATKIAPEALAGYFSRIGNILRQLEDRVQTGTVAGFDAVFTRRAGEYDQQAFLPFLEEAYRASRTQDSLDGGYFANKIDEMLRAKNKDAKPLYEQKPAEVKQSLKSLGKWGGEGISAGLLHSIIRSTEKQVQKNKRVELPAEVEADIQRAYDALYQKMIDDILAEDEAAYRVEKGVSDVVTENLGTGNMRRVIVESLSEQERAVYRELISQKMLTVDPNDQVLTLVKKLFKDYKFYQDNAAQPLPKDSLTPPKIWRNGKWISIKSTADILPGDEISYEQFTRLSLNLNKLEKKSPELVAIQQSAKQLSQRGIANAEKRAGERIARMRAEAEISARFPKFADAGTLIRNSQRIGNTVKASVNWRARVWLATLIDEGDRGIRALEKQNSVMKRLQDKAARGVDSLKAEQTEFTKILGKIETKLKKEQVATKADVSKMSVLEVIATGNGLDFLRKVREMKVVTGEDELEWDVAMEHLLNMQIVGKGSRYESFSELAQTYKTAGRNQKPGEESTVTKKQIPTDREVLEVLVGLGGTIGERAAEFIKNPKVNRNNVITLLRRLDRELTKDDIAKAKGLDFISSTNVAGGDEVRRVAETLGDDKIVTQEILNQLTIERMKLHDEGLAWMEQLVALSLGKSNQQYFMKRVDELKIAEVDNLGRNIDVDKPSYTPKRTVSKRTYETTSILLTGWSTIVATLSNMARSKGLEGAAREAFMVQSTRRILRLRDLTLHAQGIFPVSTPSSKLGEPKLLGMSNLDPEEVIKVSKPVYLTDADILDIFPDEVVAKMLFIGQAKSMPITSFVSAARLLVSAMDTLPPGAYFNQEQLDVLGTKMAVMMRNAAEKSTPLKGNKGVSHYSMNPEAFEEKMRIAIGWMLKQESATKLFEQHVINAAIATKVYKYKSGEVTGAIVKAMQKLLSSPFAATGTKIQSIIDASDAIRGLTGRGDLTPEVLLQADLDLNAVLASQLDLDSIHIARQALKMEEAAQATSAKKRLAGQKSSTPKRFLRRPADEGDYVKRVNQIRLELDKAREEGGMYNNLAAMRNLEETKKGPGVEKDDPFDVFQDHGASDVQIRRALKFGDAVMSRMFFDYGMQDLRALYSPIERKKIDLTTEFEIIGSNLNKRWETAFPNRNILREAFAIIQQVPDEILDKSLAARKVLDTALANKKKTGEAKLTPDEFAELTAESKALDPYLKLDDRDLNGAVQELWALGGRLFGGGEKSMINLDGITPTWINRNLKEVGGGAKFTWIDDEGNYTQVKDSYAFTTKDSMGDIWREWEITNPVEMMISLNSALERAHVIPSIADSAVKNFGVPKSQYKTVAEANADGLVEIKSVPTLERGKELVHFIDTDNHYFPVQIAQQLAVFSKFVSELKYIQQTGKGFIERVLQKFNVITNMTKQIMTIWTPKNYVQNAVGGVFTNNIAGVNSPFAYARAWKMLRTSGRNVKDVNATELEVQLARYEAIKGEEGFIIKEVNDPRKSDTLQITVKGKKIAISYSDLEKLANKFELYVPVAQSREYDVVDEFRDGTVFGKTKSLMQKLKATYDKPTYWLGKRAAERDDFLRATLFLDVLSKGNWGSLEQGARAAMEKVDRYHPQLQGLSTFNQKYTRQFILFYPWRSKMLGTILADILDRPGPILNQIRVQSAIMNSQEETESDVFGNMTPGSAPLPAYFKYNLDPIAVNPETGLMTKFSVANPVTDLLGSAGWLSAIDFNSYEPFPDQVIDLSYQTINRWAFQSSPFVIKGLINGIQGKTSSGTTDFMDGGYNVAADAPANVQDAFSNLGFGVWHTTFAAMFGGVFLTAKMKKMDEQKRWEEVQRAWSNYLTGLKSTPLDTLENRLRGKQEIIEKLKTIKGLP